MVSYMKSGLATSLSIAGVLLAGGSALALNSSVLQDSSTVRGTPALAATVSADALNTANGGITALAIHFHGTPEAKVESVDAMPRRPIFRPRVISWKLSIAASMMKINTTEYATAMPYSLFSTRPMM